MDSISYTTVRNSLAQTMDKVCEDHTPVIITRQKANPVVMLSLDDYHTLEETAYLLRSPRNAARLAQAIDEIEEGKAQERALTE
ncbi:MAG: type II toxin-antitoxin system prevent-host-death family antitoxin [bacterium]|nr:type II toxin-antitoxin system prevent-host-death family antitoxin [bacterium]